MLYNSQTEQFLEIEGRDAATPVWQKDLLSAREFPSVGILDPQIRVGAEAFDLEGAMNLKYVQYVLGGVGSRAIQQYPPLAALARELAQAGAHDRLSEVLLAFFRMLRAVVDWRCGKSGVDYSRLVFTVPFQWDQFDSVRASFEGVIQTVWSEHSSDITLISEVEGFAHFLFTSARNELRCHDYVQIVDLGGHTAVGQGSFVEPMTLTNSIIHVGYGVLRSAMEKRRRVRT